MNCLFGGNSCTWVLILVIIFLISQNCYDNGDCGCAARNNDCGCAARNNDCGCGCGCGC